MNDPAVTGSFYQPISEADVESVPSYRAVHKRLKKRRGRAGEQVCSGCGDSARYWAYMHDCDTELVDEFGQKYCVHIEHYSAMCPPCHNRFDEVYGEGIRGAVLTDAIVIDIRQKYSSGEFTMAKLADMYGISLSAVKHVINGRTWAHLPVINSFRRSDPGKFTYQQAEEIRALYAAGGVTHRELGRRYGVDKSTVTRIVNNLAYKHPGIGIRKTD